MGEEPRPEAATIGLAELIVAVRDELEKADAARLDRADDELLELREVELEVQFEVRRTRPGRGGLAFRVLSAGAPAAPAATPAAAAPPPPQTQRLRVLYGPAFKLVELDEGAPDGMPDWLHAPVAPGLRPEARTRLQIDDDLAGLADVPTYPSAHHPQPGDPAAGEHGALDEGLVDRRRTDDATRDDDSTAGDVGDAAGARSPDGRGADLGAAGYPRAEAPGTRHPGAGYPSSEIRGTSEV